MPGNRQAFSTAMNAADRYRWDSQWAEAAQEYQRALAEFPDDAMARGGLGFCYMQTKQWQYALNEYEFTLRRDPSNVIALSKTAELYGILNRREDAYIAYLHLADLYSQAGQGARAEAAWQKAVQLSPGAPPGAPEPHERLAAYYFGKKDIAFMIQERLAAAQGYLQRNEFSAARMQCEEVLRADPSNTQAQQLLALVMGQGQAQQPSSSLLQEAGATSSSVTGTMTGTPSNSLAIPGSSVADTVTTDNLSGGNTSIMGNMGSARNYSRAGNAGAPFATANMAQTAQAAQAPRGRVTASQVTEVLRQAQAFQTQGRFNDAIDLCEQILESGFDRPDARYFLGWLYQEQQRWNDAIHQFQLLLEDPDYALSCFYALGQCYRAMGDLRTATMHFDEAVDRVNLDALTVEESDQLVQLCQEAAESHRALGEQEQALTVYSALLGFLRSRGWNDKVTQVEQMLQQMQNSPAPVRPITPPPVSQSALSATHVIPPEQMARMHQQAQQAQLNQQGQQGQQLPPASQAQEQGLQDAPTMAINLGNVPPPASAQLPTSPQVSMPGVNDSSGELPDWLTGILSDGDKTQIGQKSPAAQPPVPPASSTQPTFVADQPTAEQRIPAVSDSKQTASEETATVNPVVPTNPPAMKVPSPNSDWLTDGAKLGNVTHIIPPEQQPDMGSQQKQAQQPIVPAPNPIEQELPQVGQAADQLPSAVFSEAVSQIDAMVPPPVVQSPQVTTSSTTRDDTVRSNPVLQPPVKSNGHQAEELLTQMAGSTSKDEILKQVAEAVVASTDSLPENIRMQVVRAMRDIQKYINHGLLTPATDECLRVIDMAPQYLDVHQVLCEIYVRQGKVEQAITKYAILVDTYIVNGRHDDAIATYRRILQLEPNNLTYRMRLINLLATQGNKEDLLHERTLAAESYLRLGYMDRALTELGQALQESPTSVPTRLNYALALQKLGRVQQAVAEYQRVLQVDPRNITALVRWHIAMITILSTGRATTYEVLMRIRWQLRGEGQRHYETVVREYQQAVETYPNNADVHFALGQMHQQAGYYDKALESYQLAMRDSAVEVMARVSAAQCLLSQGKPEEAIQQLEQSLQNVRRASTNALIDPSIWAARPREDGEEHQAPEVEISMLLAKAYGRVGKQEQMQAILRQLKQTTTHHDEVSSTLAEISARQGDVDSALQEYIDLVHHYRSKKQTENALNTLNEMVRLAPQDPRAHDELADIYINRGLLDEGIAELRLLVNIYQRGNQPEEASATYQRIGNIYAEMSDMEEALVNLRRAIELTPESLELLREAVGLCLQLGLSTEAAQYQVVIARHYFDTRQVKEAVAALQQLITIDRTNFEAYDLLGQTYQSVGEYEQASRVYRNLTKVNPENTVARERLATLQELRAR